MTQKQNGDPVGGKTFLSTSKDSEAGQVRHQHVCVIFLPSRHSLFIRNLFLEPKWWTSITAYRFDNIWGSKSAKSIQNNGRTRTGWLTRTVCWCTLLCRCSSVWPPKWGCGLGPKSSLFAWFGPFWMFLVFKNEIADISVLLPGCP